MMVAKSLAKEVNVKKACAVFTIPMPGFYRWNGQDGTQEKEKSRTVSPLGRFVERVPQEVYAALLDEGRRLCSVRIMWRVLDKHAEVTERRNQIHRPSYTKPELIAEGHNQAWSWDITKLQGPVKRTYFYLCVIHDIFSQYVVGWMIAPRELAVLAKRLIEQSCEKQKVEHDQLIIYSDRGHSMITPFNRERYRLKQRLREKEKRG